MDSEQNEMGEDEAHEAMGAMLHRGRVEAGIAGDWIGVSAKEIEELRGLLKEASELLKFGMWSVPTDPTIIKRIDKALNKGE